MFLKRPKLSEFNPVTTDLPRRNPFFPIPFSIATPKAAVTSTTSPVTVSFSTYPEVVITIPVSSVSVNFLFNAVISTPMPVSITMDLI